jgi:hypothetical protein
LRKPDYVQLADALADLAELYRRRDRSSHAEPLLQRATNAAEKVLETKQRSLGPDRVAIAVSQMFRRHADSDYRI